MSKSLPWGKFFWSDYESDEALRLCSFAAQGLWMRCLCLTAKADPTGYLVINGHPLSTTDIARLTGGSEAEVGELLIELERNGAFSRDAKNRIYSRRMVRDVKKAAIARKNGKRGGNPSLSKQTENQPLVNLNDNPALKLRDQKPDTRSHIDKKVCKSKPTYPEDFEEFWKVWQGTPAKWKTHVKAEALPAWKALSEEDRVKAVCAVIAYQAACKKADHDPKAAVRYLKLRAFEGYEPQVVDNRQIVTRGTPEYAAVMAWKIEDRKKRGLHGDLPLWDTMPIPEGYTPPMENTQ